MSNKGSSKMCSEGKDSTVDYDETDKKESVSNNQADTNVLWKLFMTVFMLRQKQPRNDSVDNCDEDRKVTSNQNVSLFRALKKNSLRFSLLIFVWYLFRFWCRTKKRKQRTIVATAATNHTTNNNNRMIPNIHQKNKMEEIPFASVFALLQSSSGIKVQDIWMNENGREVVVSLLQDGSSSSWKIIKNVIPEQMSQLASSFFQQQKKLPKSLPQSKYESLKRNALQIFIASSPFLYLIFMYYMLQNLYRQQTQQQNEDDIFEKNNRNDNHLTLKDVAGMEEVKAQLTFSFHQASRKKGDDYSHVLLYGPPGNGKTLLARALAETLLQTNEIDAVQCCNASDFVELYVGQGAKRIRNIFQSLKHRAIQKYNSENSTADAVHSSLQNKACALWKYFFDHTFAKTNCDPSTKSATDRESNNGCLRFRPPIALLIIDELDSLAKSREGMKMSSSNHTGGGHEEREQTLLALFTELDVALLPSSPSSSSVRKCNKNNNHAIVLVVGATNRPNVLDPALVRRFTKQIFISNPDSKTRESIIQHYLDKHIEKEIATQDFDILELASLTDDFACSDIQQIIQHASWINSFEQKQHLSNSKNNNRHDGNKNGMNNTGITQSHLKCAIETIRQQKSNIFNYQPYAWSSYNSK